jgi:hypothetical protein
MLASSIGILRAASQEKNDLSTCSRYSDVSGHGHKAIPSAAKQFLLKRRVALRTLGKCPRLWIAPLKSGVKSCSVSSLGSCSDWLVL